MTDSVVNVIRGERTTRLLRRVHDGVSDWLALRKNADVNPDGQYVGRHQTQLAALEGTLAMAAERLLAQATDLKRNLPEGEFFDQCRLLDEAAVWLERVWQFYRDKFDQREHPEMGPVVRAADEMVWSCYHDAMDRARPGAKHRPQPLPFVAPEYSPAALESDKSPPASLLLQLQGPVWTDDLRRATRSLPITLLRLPPWCIGDPWWLVFVAHEVGHHVQADLGLVEPFSKDVAAAVGAAGATPADVIQWTDWSREIFADMFSVTMVGPSAIHAVAEVERSTDARMRMPLSSYPAPILRLYLMEAAAASLGIAPAAQAAGLQQETVTIADAVVACSLGPLPGIKRTLADICGFATKTFSANGEVASWETALAKVPPPTGFVPAIETARYVVAGSLGAWNAAAATDNPQAREAARAQLSASTIQTVALSGPPGVRAQFVEADTPEDAGDVLLEALLNAAREHGTGHAPPE